MLKTLCPAAGASLVGSGGEMPLFILFPHMFLHGLFVIGGGLPLHKGNGAGGAGRQAVA